MNDSLFGMLHFPRFYCRLTSDSLAKRFGMEYQRRKLELSMPERNAEYSADSPDTFRITGDSTLI